MEESRIGPFALERKLSSDGTGSVYQAVHVEQKKLVALKVFWAPLAAASDTSKLKYWNDFDTLKGLRHSNIVRCLGADLEEQYGWIALELVRGGTLATFLRRRKQLPWELVVDVSQRICAGLQFAHEQKVLHGGLAPDKILLSDDGHVKIAGFLMDRICSMDYATAGKGLLEKAMYLAPEQIPDDPHVTFKSDLYALGCIMYQMLTGHPPFVARSVDQVLKQHLHITPPRVSTVVLECPIWLDLLVRQLMEKDPGKRPRLASAVAVALDETKRKVAAGIGVAEHALGGLSPLETGVTKKEARQVLGHKKKKKKNVEPFYEKIWFLATTLALIIALFVWFLWPLSEQQMIERADALMSTENENGEWRKAYQDYLEPLLKRYPNGIHAEKARRHLDTIEMDRAERQLQIKTRQGRAPQSEGERLYLEAWNYEFFGDRITALEKYRGIVTLLADEEPDRAYVNLARRQIHKIEADDSSDDRLRFLEQQLEQADQLAAAGNQFEARELWRSIIKLYANHQEFRHIVEIAEARWSGKTGDADERDETTSEVDQTTE